MILLIKESEITKYTPLSGNIDLYKLIPSYRIAQITMLKEVLGRELLDKITQDFVAGSLTGDYKTLYDLYIKNMLIHLATSYYLTTGAYQIDNRGIFKHRAENVENVEQEDIDYIVKQQYKYYTYFKKGFYKEIKNLNIPEYKGNTSFKNVTKIGGWVFQDKKC